MHEGTSGVAIGGNNPNERLAGALSELAEAVDRVHGAVSRAHGVMYGEFDHPPNSRKEEDTPVPAGRVAALQEKVSCIHAQVRLAEEIAEALESCA